MLFFINHANAHWLIDTLMITDPILLAQNVTPRLLRCSSFSNILVISWFLLLTLLQNFKKNVVISCSNTNPNSVALTGLGHFVFWK